jgi:2'-5' RNA ligase
MPRIFTGLEIPAEIAQTLSLLRGGLPGARWIDPQNYHLTLRFIGDVDSTVAREVASMLDQLKRVAFQLRFDGLSSFGGRKPRAVVAGVAPSPALLDLQAEHERVLRRIGLEPEGRKYVPHVTLARLRQSSSRQVADYLAGRGLFRSAPFAVDRFVLFSSRASVGGGPYVVEAAFPLDVAKTQPAA